MRPKADLPLAGAATLSAKGGPASGRNRILLIAGLTRIPSRPASSDLIFPCEHEHHARKHKKQSGLAFSGKLCKHSHAVRDLREVPEKAVDESRTPEKTSGLIG